MSLWKQNKIKKQQRKKRAKKVLKARDEVLSLLLADKVKKAGEMASAMLTKHPGDIRAWRLVAGVKAWERFDERIRGISSKRREELKSSALKVMKRELVSRDNLKAEVLAETLISLVPAGEALAEEVPAPAPEALGESPAEKAPSEEVVAAPAAKTLARRSSSSRKTNEKEKPSAEKKAEKAPTKKSSASTKKTSTPKKTEKPRTEKKAGTKKKTN